MKKIYMTMVALLCGVAAMAYDNELYVPEVTVKPGDKGQIEICLKNAAPVQMIGFKFKTATGIKLTTKVADFTVVEDRLDVDLAKNIFIWNKKKELDKGDIDEDEYNDAVAEAEDFGWSDLYEVAKPSTFTFGPKTSNTSGKDDTGTVQYCVFKGNDGALLTCPVTVDASVAEGAYELELTNIVIATPDPDKGSVNLSLDHPTATFTVNVGDGTGINSINAEDSKAPVYNVAGQRVSKAQKGVYIQNGKKVAVK